MRYVKDFARIMVLTEEGFNDTELRIITGLSEKTIREYKDLIEIYSTQDYQDRRDQLRGIFRKKTILQKPGETQTVNPGEWNC
jgi:hypothetical protein